MILLIALAAILAFGLVRSLRFAVCNVAYILTHPRAIKRSGGRLRAFYAYSTDLLALDSWIDGVFRYKSDKIDYASWPIVFSMKKWYGDCDDIASLVWAWACKNNRHASYVSIKRPNHQVGHAVCLVKEGGVWSMVDSTGVVEFMGWGVHYPNCKIIVRKTR